MKLIIAGGRDYELTNADLKMLHAIRITFDIQEVVSGGARGADTGGERWAESVGLKVTRFPAEWDKYGKSAGYRRNEQMAEYADAVIVFPGGKGTNHMFDIAQKHGLLTFDHRTPIHRIITRADYYENMGD